MTGCDTSTKSSSSSSDIAAPAVALALLVVRFIGIGDPSPAYKSVDESNMAADAAINEDVDDVDENNRRPSYCCC